MTNNNRLNFDIHNRMEDIATKEYGQKENCRLSLKPDEILLETETLPSTTVNINTNSLKGTYD